MLFLIMCVCVRMYVCVCVCVCARAVCVCVRVCHAPLADVICCLLGKNSLLKHVVQGMDSAQLQSLFLVKHLALGHTHPVITRTFSSSINIWVTLRPKTPKVHSCTWAASTWLITYIIKIITIPSGRQNPRSNDLSPVRNNRCWVPWQ